MFNTIVNNDDYRKYIKSESTVQITAVSGTSPGFFDKYANATFYPDNYKSAIAQDAKNGPMYTAAATIHALWEQYASQIYDNPFDMNPAPGTPDDQAGGTFGGGSQAEENVLQTAGWGQRFQQKLQIVPGAPTVIQPIFYVPKGGGRPIKVFLEYDKKTFELKLFRIVFPPAGV